MTFKPKQIQEGTINMQRWAYKNHLDYAKTLGYETVRAMYTDMYVKQGMSLSIISRKLGIDSLSIRRMLQLLDIEIKPRGGKNHKSRKRT